MLILAFLFLFVCLFLLSLCSPGCPETYSVDQSALKLRNPPASAFQVLGLKAYATMPTLVFRLLFNDIFIYYM